LTAYTLVIAIHSFVCTWILPIQKLCEHKDKGLAKGFAFDLFGNETTNIFITNPAYSNSFFILFQRLPIAHAHPGPNIFYWTWTFGHPEPGNLDFWTFGLWTSSWPAEGFFIGLGLWTSEFGHCPNFRAGPIWT
jgi:hypothetical protein